MKTTHENVSPLNGHILQNYLGTPGEEFEEIDSVHDDLVDTLVERYGPPTTSEQH